MQLTRDNVTMQKYTASCNCNAIGTKNICTNFCAISQFGNDTIIEIKFKVNAITRVESITMHLEINVTKLDICSTYYSYVNWHMGSVCESLFLTFIS